MGLLINVISFLLTGVLTGMAYFEYKTTKDKMFLYLSAGFAFLVVMYLAETLEFTNGFGDLPLAALSLIGYSIVIYGMYAQSKIYKVIK